MAEDEQRFPQPWLDEHHPVRVWAGGLAGGCPWCQMPMPCRIRVYAQQVRRAVTERRTLLDFCVRGVDPGHAALLGGLALLYADHADFREEWRPLRDGIA